MRLLGQSWAVVILSGGMLMGQVPQPQAPDAGGRGTSGAIQRRARPPARIMSFAAEPASINAGESVLLTWATENPNGVTLDPGPGRVTPRGTIRVTPARTTTYTLSVDGPNGTQTKSITVNVAGTTAAAAGAAVSQPAKREVPRLANGKPDLSGVYNFGGGGGRGGAGRGAAAAPAGPVLKAGAERFKVVRSDKDTGRTSDCMPLAGPDAFGVPYQFQLVESANGLAILHEYPGTFRTIPTTGIPHVQDPDPTWMGDSVGHWEGDTLVVDTIGFNDKTEISGYKHTESLHIVERFSRPNFETLQYQAVIEDPNVFAQPFAVNRSFSLRPDLARVDEFVCENNRDYTVLFNK